MTYVVTDACIRCKYMDCVEVCPVDCFYEGERWIWQGRRPPRPVPMATPDPANAFAALAGLVRHG